jgi:hypothetical protein
MLPLVNQLQRKPATILFMETRPNKKNELNGPGDTSQQPVAGWRLKCGVALFVLSIAAPLIGVPVVAALGLSATITASVSGILLVGAEVLGIVAIAVMGKAGYVYIKSRFFGFLKQYGPPKEVSRLRYRLGLVMFTVPVLFGWISIYAGQLIPGFTKNPLPFALGGDILLLASLLVLGGSFWDKIRALFIYDSKVDFTPK